MLKLSSAIVSLKNDACRSRRISTTSQSADAASPASASAGEPASCGSRGVIRSAISMTPGRDEHRDDRAEAVEILQHQLSTFTMLMMPCSSTSTMQRTDRCRRR